MTRKLNLVLAQLNPRVGDLRNNADRAIEVLRQHPDADVIVFPECFLTGYPIEDLVLRPAFLAATERELARVTEAVVAVGGPAVVMGAPEEGPALPYNAAYFISPDGSKKVARKRDRPNDGVFDEVRNFACGDFRPPIKFRGVRIGIGICEEMWHPSVAQDLAGELADVLIFINGSPYTRGKHRDQRMAHAKARVRETGLPLVYLNTVGGQDELVFDGASFVLDEKGLVRAQLPAFKESIQTISVPFGDEFPHQEPYPEDEVADYLACVLGLRDYVNKSRFMTVVLGMSGGIDSALVGTMAVDALGADRVKAVTLPSTITEKGDIADAVEVCARLGIELATVPIGEPVEAICRMLGIAGRVPNVTEENIQARVRMIALMAHSNEHGHMLLSTGNKSEGSVGYATLYGDMAGGFNPIKDIYKTDVWSLSRMRNEFRPEGVLGPDAPIPPAIIAKAPSANLALGQTDEAKLGPYAILDELLRGFVDEDMDSVSALARARTAIGADGDPRFLTNDHTRFVGALLRQSEHKRRQSAPGPKVGPRAFGRDRRLPIVNAFEM
ncbi:Glutamine-dependent NAD(+) synthetase [Hyphomicrobiales bacterium]|nr:Glutamine-dependent NAD(+) synthetase [Hyphomicrobiales bacterium]CAH1702759.1 Glutamine-dependent NAD(+) synthetase [Hyphomicrobiales bacterium]CAI0346949.1 Glutamine-dependent NAD(+) synthetase [Hyphomicrobiales bacterium]